MDKLSTILDSINIDLTKLEADFSVKDNSYIQSGHSIVSLAIEFPGTLPIYLLYSKDKDFFEITLSFQRDPELIYDENTPDNAKSLVQDILRILENNYVLETRGGQNAYIHVIDSTGIFVASYKCVNFPFLLMGGKKFRLFKPIINEIRKKYSIDLKN
jgi:hypothetical protein